MRVSKRVWLWSAAVGAGVLTGARAIRPAAHQVESTEDERIARLPGEELIAQPPGSLTNAVRPSL